MSRFVNVTFKTPDALRSTLDEVAVSQGSDSEKTDEEIDRDEEILANWEILLNQYIKYGEYVTLEFDLVEGTVRVCPSR